MNIQSQSKKQSFPIGALILLFLNVLGAVNTLPLLQHLGNGYTDFSIIFSVINVLASLLISILLLCKKRSSVLLFPIAVLIFSLLASFLSSWRNFTALALIAMWVVIALTILSTSSHRFASLKRGKRVLSVILIIASIIYGVISVINAATVVTVTQTYTETSSNDYFGKSTTDAGSDSLQSQGKQYGFTALAATSESESESESESDESINKHYYASDISGSFATVIPWGNVEDQTSIGYVSGGESDNIIHFNKDTFGKYDIQIEHVDTAPSISPLDMLLNVLYSAVSAGAYIVAILLIKRWLDESAEDRSESEHYDDDEQTEVYEELSED